MYTCCILHNKILQDRNLLIVDQTAKMRAAVDQGRFQVRGRILSYESTIDVFSGQTVGWSCGNESSSGSEHVLTKHSFDVERCKAQKAEGGSCESSLLPLRQQASSFCMMRLECTRGYASDWSNTESFVKVCPFPLPPRAHQSLHKCRFRCIRPTRPRALELSLFLSYFHQLPPPFLSPVLPRQSTVSTWPPPLLRKHREGSAALRRD